METMDTTEYQDPPAPHGNMLARREFSGTAMVQASAAAEALVAKERANAEAKWIIAMRRPRNMDAVRQDILKECRRPGFADAAVYEVPRGGTKIVGLSIRFAEVAVRCMGNLQPEVITVFDGDDTRLVRCTVTDYESNVTWSKDITVKKTVERKQIGKGQRVHGERLNSYGDRVYIVDATDDDVNTKEAALVSKALRTLILRCIPGHIQDEALALCNKIYADKQARDPDAARVAMLDAFASVSIKPTDLEELLGHTTERMQPAEVDRLRKIYAAISEGHTTWHDVITEHRETAPKAQPAVSSPVTTPAPSTSASQPQGATNAAPAQQAGATSTRTRSEKPKGSAALKQTLAQQPTGGNPTSKLDQAANEARARDAAREERKVTESTQPDPALSTQPAAGPDPAMDEPAWMSGRGRYEKGATIGPAQLPPEQGPPEDGNEYRGCNDCGVLIEAPITEARGSLCYTCRQA
jgi:hypothetical protein